MLHKDKGFPASLDPIPWTFDTADQSTYFRLYTNHPFEGLSEVFTTYFPAQNDMWHTPLYNAQATRALCPIALDGARKLLAELAGLAEDEAFAIT